MKLLVLTLCFIFIACATKPKVEQATPDKASIIPIDGLTTLGKSIGGQEIQLGGFSGLQKVRFNEKLNEYELVTLTDRGPNSEYITLNEKKVRPFLLPNYQPRIVHLIVNTKKLTAEMVSDTKLWANEKKKMTGLPTKALDEIPVDAKGKSLALDELGSDTESITIDSLGSYWIGEEYAPAILKVSSSGVVLKRLTPGNGLPEIFKNRRLNGGLEGIAYQDGSVFTILQRPILEKQRMIRISEVDAETNEVKAQFAYFTESSESDRIGDLVSVGNGKFLTIEQDGKTDEKSFKKIFLIDIKGATNINGTLPLNNEIEITDLQFNDQKLIPVKKTEVVDLSSIGLSQFMKLEGLAILNDTTLALVNDNDFKLNGSVDTKTGTCPTKEEISNFILVSLKNSLANLK